MDHTLVLKEHWSTLGQQEGLKAYDVVIGGTVIGSVEGFHPTLEKKIPGERYVAWRRKSRTLHWVADYSGVRNKYRLPYRTRKEAIEQVIWAHSQREQPFKLYLS